MKLELERTFKASKEQLYALWTDPKTISQWFGVKVVIDPKVGGALNFDFGEKVLTSGTFKELSPFDKVAFTWKSVTCSEGTEESTGDTLVTVTFEKISSDQTQMRLVHSGFNTEAAKNDHNDGWTDYLAKWEKKFAT